MIKLMMPPPQELDDDAQHGGGDQGGPPHPPDDNTGGGVSTISEIPKDPLVIPATDRQVIPAAVTAECTYEKGGVCWIHGPGAKLRWKQGMKTTDGKRKRVYYYEFDPEPGGVKKMKQVKLSFNRRQQDSGR